MKVASVVICGMDLHILGVYLKRDQNDIWRLVNGRQDVQACSLSDSLFLLQLGAKSQERWGLLIEALINLDQRVKVKELGLDVLHKNSQSQPH